MDDGALKTLFLPFETGDIKTGGEKARWLYLNAMKPPVGAILGKGNLFPVQGFKPLFNALQAAQCPVSPEVAEGEFDGALILISRHRVETRDWLNKAMARVKTGGPIVVSGAKTDGIASVAKDISDRFEITGNLSKHHAKVIWFGNTKAEPFPLTEAALVDGRFETAPGMFSSDHIDPGSAFLIENLPADMKGRIADFCAGWGYLSVEAAKRAPGIKSVALYEAHHASLEAARRNMQTLAPGLSASFHWQDLVTERATGNYDTIIMNPPFHQGRAAEPSIGLSIIRNAHGALHRGGKLYLVANRNLPYEATLQALFFKSGEMARNNYYKVLWATK